MELRRLGAASLVETAIEATRRATRTKELHVEGTLGSGCDVLGDEARLEQVFQRILASAASLTPTGGSIRVSLVERGRHIEVSVVHGGGPQADFLEPFEHSIVRAIVEMHVGTLTLDGSGGLGGTMLRVRLPVAR